MRWLISAAIILLLFSSVIALTPYSRDDDLNRTEYRQNDEFPINPLTYDKEPKEVSLSTINNLLPKSQNINFVSDGNLSILLNKKESQIRLGISPFSFLAEEHLLSNLEIDTDLDMEGFSIFGVEDIDADGDVYVGGTLNAETDLQEGGASISTIYANLVGTNQPFTGNVTLTKDNPKLTLNDTGDGGSSYEIRSDFGKMRFAQTGFTNFPILELDQSDTIHKMLLPSTAGGMLFSGNTRSFYRDKNQSVYSATDKHLTLTAETSVDCVPDFKIGAASAAANSSSNQLILEFKSLTANYPANIFVHNPDAPTIPEYRFNTGTGNTAFSVDFVGTMRLFPNFDLGQIMFGADDDVSMSFDGIDFLVTNIDGKAPLIKFEDFNGVVDGDWNVHKETFLGSADGSYSQYDENGTLTLHGNAKVVRELIFKAGNATKGASAPTDALRDIGASGGVKDPVISFSKTIEQEIYGSFHPPNEIDNDTNISFHLMWLPADDWTSGDYVWCLEYIIKKEDVIYGDANTTSGTPTTICETITPDNAVDYIETEYSQTIDIDFEENLIAHFYRDVASDDADATGEVRFFEVEYTMASLGETLP